MEKWLLDSQLFDEPRPPLQQLQCFHQQIQVWHYGITGYGVSSLAIKD